MFILNYTFRNGKKSSYEDTDIEVLVAWVKELLRTHAITDWHIVEVRKGKKR